MDVCSSGQGELRRTLVFETRVVSTQGLCDGKSAIDDKLRSRAVAALL